MTQKANILLKHSKPIRYDLLCRGELRFQLRFEILIYDEQHISTLILRLPSQRQCAGNSQIIPVFFQLLSLP